MRRALAVLAVLWLGALGARADGDVIWSALVLATNEKAPQSVPEKLADYAPTIKKVFGYNSLYLMGDKKRELVSGGEEWLVPSKEFFMLVRCRAREATAYALSIELYRNHKMLVSADVKLARGAPLYIRGPQWGGGQLIFLLDVR